MSASRLQSRLETYVASSGAGETVRAFIPPPLPPVPKLELDGLYQRLERANQSLGRLNSMTKLLPDVRFLLYLYVRKEALVSGPRGSGQRGTTLTFFAKDREKIQKLGRGPPSALRVQELMQRQPFVRIRTAAKDLKLTVPTVTSALNHLVQLVL